MGDISENIQFGNEMQTRHNNQTSKITMYNLEELVISLHLQGFKAPKIAKECNLDLESRADKDQIEYKRINETNIYNYLRSNQNKLARGDVKALDTFNKQLPDCVEKIQSLVNMLEIEIDKLRSVDSPIVDSKQRMFNTLIDKLLQAIELSSKIQGVIQPQVAVAIFNSISANVERFVKKINESQNLSQEAKDEVLRLVRTELLTDSLVESIGGSVIDVDARKV